MPVSFVASHKRCATGKVLIKSFKNVVFLVASEA